MKYKRMLTGYINQNDRGQYLTITNVSDEPIVLEPKGKLFLNVTPQEVLEKNPKVPNFSKSVKVEE